MLRTVGIVAALCLFAPTAARAGDLQEATRLLDNMEYKRAIKSADRVLKSPKSGPHELMAAYRIKGLSLSALGKADRSLAAFKRLLAIDPSFRLSPDTSPKLAAPFYQAVAMLGSQKGIELRHDPPEPAGALAGLELKVALKSDPHRMVKTIQLWFHTDLDGKERRMVARTNKPGTVVMKLPAGLLAGQIRYYLKATNRHGGILARIGSRQEPLVLTAAKVEAPAGVPVAPAPAPAETPAPVKTPEPPPPPEALSPLADLGGEEPEPAPAWYQTWWFWTAAGVATAMIVGGIVLAADSPMAAGSADYGIRIE
jgi:hypothetical protein